MLWAGVSSSGFDIEVSGSIFAITLMFLKANPKCGLFISNLPEEWCKTKTLLRIWHLLIMTCVSTPLQAITVTGTCRPYERGEQCIPHDASGWQWRWFRHDQWHQKVACLFEVLMKTIESTGSVEEGPMCNPDCWIEILASWVDAFRTSQVVRA
jgi:hypothetical protein